MNFTEYRIIIAGSRDFKDYELLKRTLDNYIQSIQGKSFISIISGTANGADKLGEQYAFEHDYLLERFPADWNTGKTAGRFRNAKMADYASLKKGVLFAFWDGKSVGTKHMIECAKKYGLEVHVINY